MQLDDYSTLNTIVFCIFLTSHHVVWLTQQFDLSCDYLTELLNNTVTTCDYTRLNSHH